MPDPRILDFTIPVRTGTTAFQIGYSADGVTWTLVKVAGATDLAVGLLTDRVYTLDGVNTTDDANNNVAAASMAPAHYRVRTKASSLYTAWGGSFVFPSEADFLDGMKQQLKDPSLIGGVALLSDADYRLKLVNALSAFEQRHPRLADELYDLTSNVLEYLQPEEWSPSYSYFTQLEYPVGTTPRSFYPVDYLLNDEQSATWRFRRINPGPAEQARLFYHTRHSRDGSTVPVLMFESVLMWAVGDAAQQLRAKTNQFGDFQMGNDYSSIDPRIKMWGQIADAWKAQAEHIWGSGVTGVRAHISSYEDHGRIPARALVR